VPSGDLHYRVGFYTRDAPAAPGSPPPPDYGSAPGYPTTPTFVVWANIEPRLGGEAILADRLTGKNFVNITVRQSVQTNAIDSDWICKDENTGELYNIRSVIDPQKGNRKHGLWLEMLCEKGVAV
jgi:head-tail adaptor